MKFGISHPLPVYPNVNLDPAFVAKVVEDVGFESYWVADHLIAPIECASYSPVFPGGQVPGFLDPMMALARASVTTERIKFGPSVLLMPERNPIQLAKEIATIDVYSGGRFVLAIGSGWNKEESVIMGGDPKRPWAQSLEAVEVLKDLWTNEVSEHHGEFYDYPQVRCAPKPLQKPHPPVLIGGIAKRVLERVVKYGEGWLPHRYSPEELAPEIERLRRLMDEAGRDFDALDISFTYGEGTDRGLIERYEKAGVQRLIVRSPAGLSEDEFVEAMHDHAKKLMG